MNNITDFKTKYDSSCLPPLIFIFDFDKTILNITSSEYTLDKLTKTVVHIDDKFRLRYDQIYDIEFINTLKYLKDILGKHIRYVILSATINTTLTDYINTLFPELFDIVIDVKMCSDNLKLSNKYSVLDHDTSFHLYDNVNKKYTKAPCLDAIVQILKGHRLLTFFFDDNESIIQSAFLDSKNVKWLHHCKTPLENQLFLDTISPIIQIIYLSILLYNNIPTNRYINQQESLSILNNSMSQCCNYYNVLYMSDLLNLQYECQYKKNIMLPKYSDIFDVETLMSLVYYFKFVDNFFNKYGHNSVFSLGDSLDKYNYIWNLFNNNKISIIPFSGSAYTDDFESKKIVFDVEMYNNMKHSFPSLIANNAGFRELYNKIVSGKNVLITDFGLTGKSIISIVKLLLEFHPHISLKNVTYLLISYSTDETMANISEHISDLHGMNIIYADYYIGHYFTNSEESQSRCVPKYGSSSWNKLPDDVWKNNLLNNYHLCNIHRCIFMLQICCTYNVYIENKELIKIDDNNKFINSTITNLKKMIDQLISNNQKINTVYNHPWVSTVKQFVVPMVDLDGGYYEKYMKYKQKYYKLRTAFSSKGDNLKA